MKAKLHILSILLLTVIAISACKKEEDKNENPTPSITDADGNVYTSVVIGTQTWLKENLQTTKYSNGESIGYLTEGDGAWGSTTSGAVGYFNDDAALKTEYGAYYNWLAISDPRGICPAGYHVPSDDEYTTLIDFLGGEVDAGTKMKETGFEHWKTPNSGTNSSGFTAIGSGIRTPGGDSKDTTIINWLWSSTDFTSTGGSVQLFYNNEDANQLNSAPKSLGLSCRCLKD